MANDLRQTKFRIGCLHGKLQASDSNSEAHIQRTVFLTGRITINYSQAFKPAIRIFGYEIPLKDYGRGMCIDLLGYDDEHNLYVIELKKKDSSESISKAISQINKYAMIVKEIKSSLEDDFKTAYFFPVKFKSIKKMIIAPREYFKHQRALMTDRTIEYGHFRDKDINVRKPGVPINIHLE